jgi:hypothetical protein
MNQCRIEAVHLTSGNAVIRRFAGAAFEAAMRLAALQSMATGVAATRHRNERQTSSGSNDRHDGQIVARAPVQLARQPQRKATVLTGM